MISMVRHTRVASTFSGMTAKNDKNRKKKKRKKKKTTIQVIRRKSEYVCQTHLLLSDTGEEGGGWRS